MENNCRVMVVDDSKNDRAALSSMLRHANIDVREAPGGAQALALAREFKPHVFVIDISMPIMNGFVLLKALRVIDAPAEAIIVTGFDNRDTERQAAELGAFSYLPKPVKPQILLANIKNAMAKVAAKSGI